MTNLCCIEQEVIHGDGGLFLPAEEAKAVPQS